MMRLKLKSGMVYEVAGLRWWRPRDRKMARLMRDILDTEAVQRATSEAIRASLLYGVNADNFQRLDLEWLADYPTVKSWKDDGKEVAPR